MLVAALLFLVGTAPAFAQVSSYTFSQSSPATNPGTAYVPVTGTTTVHASGWDDSSAVAPIGFSFTFNGVAYTNVNVNSNGYLTFGSTVPSGYTPISATAGYNGVIAAYAGT